YIVGLYRVVLPDPLKCSPRHGSSDRQFSDFETLRVASCSIQSSWHSRSTKKSDDSICAQLQMLPHPRDANQLDRMRAREDTDSFRGSSDSAFDHSLSVAVASSTYSFERIDS